MAKGPSTPNGGEESEGVMSDAACDIDELSYCCCAISFGGSGAGTFDTLEKRGLGGRLDGLYLEDRGARYPLFAFDPFALMDA